MARYPYLGNQTLQLRRYGEKDVIMSFLGLPEKQGLYDPRNEHDACGIGFVADIKGRKNHDIVKQGLEILKNLTHRGAVGAAQVC